MLACTLLHIHAYVRTGSHAYVCLFSIHMHACVRMPRHGLSGFPLCLYVYIQACVHVCVMVCVCRCVHAVIHVYALLYERPWLFKVSKGAKIRNRYNQVPHLRLLFYFKAIIMLTCMPRHSQTSVCMYVCLFVCLYVCMHLGMYAYIHTDRQTDAC